MGEIEAVAKKQKGLKKSRVKAVSTSTGQKKKQENTSKDEKAVSKKQANGESEDLASIKMEKQKKEIKTKKKVAKKNDSREKNEGKKRKEEEVKEPESVRHEDENFARRRRRERKALRLTQKRRKVVLFFFCTSFVAAITFLTLWPKFRFSNFRTDIKIEYQEEFDYKNGEVCFGNFLSCENVEMEVDGEVDVNELGEYRLVYRAWHNSRTTVRETIVRVVDETAPDLELLEFDELLNNIEDGEELPEIKVSVCPNGKIPRIRMKAEDRHDGDLTDKIVMEFDGEDVVTISVTDEVGNRSEYRVRGVIEDLVAPVIEMNGEESKTIIQGSGYEDTGARAVDNCDGDVDVTMEGTVNTGIAGIYEIKYKSKDSAGNMSEKNRTIKVVNPENGNRVVYLTFDDGPGEYTGKLLDILAKYGVKATFFVTGRGDDGLIKREYDEGHTVALHTNSHNYAYVYASADNYFADLYAVRDRVQRITGVAPTLIRFLGGSSNTISANYDGGTRIMSYLTGEVERRGFSYADWNVSSGDAGSASTANEVYNNVVYRLGEGRSVVLQHDIKGFSVDAVERIIQYGLANGYTFLPMSAGSFMAHHGVNN